ncbi:MAG: VCBS repeat-containing protein [Phycisphaerales bacterium]|nr:VCBS repeat-containing protein [Phycisphaerales bacterium]
MNTWNLIGCTATSLLLGASALGGSVAVSVVDLGCGTPNCGPDTHGDIIRHDASTGEITLHYMTQSGVDLIESEFTLDDLVIEDVGNGNYSAGTIIFNNTGTGGTGASASYEVDGKLSELAVAAPGGGYDTALDALDTHGVHTFKIAASLRNDNGTFADGVGATGTAFVAPFPGGNPNNSNRSWFTAFSIESPGFGGPPNSSVRMELQSFTTLTDPALGNIIGITDENGGLTTFLRAGDIPNNDSNWLHESSQSIPADKDPNPNLFYFNQQNTNGFGDAFFSSVGVAQPPIFFRDNNDGLSQVEFTQKPVIKFYRAGEVMHASLDSTTEGFASAPVFHEAGLQPPVEFDGSTGLVYAPNHNSSEASFRVSWSRRGPINVISDFNPGSGYDSIPTIALSDPDGFGSDASVTLESTEAFSGGPRKMVYADTQESVFLPGSGWKALPGDFNGDGSPDLLWWSRNFGASSIWILKNGHLETTQNLPDVGTSWVPVVADLDNDSRSDIFWWDSETGSTHVWGISPDEDEWVTFSQASQPVVDLGWELVSVTERYGREALMWQNRYDGTTGSWTMSNQAPHVVDRAADFTWANGELLVPGPNWEVIGTGDLNGDGQNGDLLWHSNDEYDRIAFWMIGQTNFLEGDYLTFNGQEVTIDAQLGGIGTYTTDRHTNLIWNDGGRVVNWQMARSEQSSGGSADTVDSINSLDSSRDDETSTGTNSNSSSDTTVSPPVLGPLAYRLSSGWSMDENGLLASEGFDFFDGYPADLDQGSNDTPQGGSGSGGGADDDSSDSSDSPIEIPDLGDLPSGGGIPDTAGGVTVPSGVNECDYLCELDRNDPTGWPPEFQTAPPEVIQSIWDILVDGLLDSYGCDPCPVVEVPTGACCIEASGVCSVLTEAECTFPGTEWLGAGTTCDDCG